MKDILDKCTAYDPDDRYQDVDELKDALTLEDFDEPTLTEEELRKWDMFFLAARVLLFVIRREFHAPLIVLMIVIVLLATSQTLNSGEDFQETVEELE